MSLTCRGKRDCLVVNSVVSGFNEILEFYAYMYNVNSILIFNKLQIQYKVFFP